ncbi:enoyl-CoA hydratase/isomerase family protein [Cryobacterium sp. HLT2-28]|uniref:enoyl-CoA hydratase/isomerase family protein n=1 Tax=Cryobacterium sp. HLT2-28 TaxID=1259146 RepID=UPI00106AFC99|nr:enoyl-CoA hydratase-related protein [Cryobacterium sp. HLT2-28]TFB97629.1 enoyl-CoA hydratase/isomerase family protein [Cryobacterium sp. HLT2-28]
MNSVWTTRIDVSNRTVGGRTIALVVFTPPAGGMISWTRAALAALAAAVDAIDLAAVDAVAFTGTGTVFGAGADLVAFGSVSSLTEGEQIARDGYAAFNRLGRLELPTFAFLNGVALGGAFELALRADFRTVTARATNLGLPGCASASCPAGAGWACSPTWPAPRQPRRSRSPAPSPAVPSRPRTSPRAGSPTS